MVALGIRIISANIPKCIADRGYRMATDSGCVIWLVYLENVQRPTKSISDRWNGNYRELHLVIVYGGRRGEEQVFFVAKTIWGGEEGCLVCIVGGQT